MTKRILSGFVALLMVLAIIPAMSFAEDAPVTSDLIISEMIEGSSSNKSIEVYNGTGADVDLSAYKLVLYSNGNATGSNTATLSGTLAAGDVYVVSNASSNADILAVTDQTSNVCYINGDDAFVLTKNDVIIDVFGVVGSDPGTAWTGTFEDGTAYTTIDKTWVRKSTVTSPVTTWNVDEWEMYDNDTVSYLGWHINAPTATQVESPVATPAAGAIEYGQLITLICATANSTIYYSVDEGDTFVAYTAPFALTADATVYAYATADGIADSATVTFAYTVAAELTAVTIAEVQALADDVYAKTTGIVTFIDGRNVYIEDATGALCLYFASSSDTGLAAVALGDSITAVGMKDTYNGLVEMTNVNGQNPLWYTVNSTGNELPVQNVTLAEIVASPSTYQCERVFLDDATLGIVNNSGNTPLTQGEASLNIYKMPTLTGIDSYDVVDLYGVIGWFNGAQLRVAQAADVTLVTPMYSLTINYVYADGTTASASVVAPYAEGAAYSVVSPVITGYIADVLTVEGTMGAVDAVVTVTYTVDPAAVTYTLTINYVYEDGTAAATVYTEELSENAAYSVTSPVIDGFTADMLVVSGTMGAEAITVTVTYTAIASHYYAQISSMADVIEGDYIIYSYAYAGVYEGAMSNTMTTTGRVDAVAATFNGEYIVDETSNMVMHIAYVEGSGYTIYNAAAGMYIEITANTTSGYSMSATPTVYYTIAVNANGGFDIATTATGNRGICIYTNSFRPYTVGGTNYTAAHLYKYVEGVVPASHTLTVNYLYTDGTVASDVYTAVILEGAAYSVTSPVIAGFIADTLTVEGTMGTEDITVNVTYSVDPASLNHSLTITYVYADGTTAGETYTNTLAEGAAYSVVSPVIAGYTADTLTVEGTMGTEDVAVTVTYTAIPTHTLTITYLYADGTTAGETYTEVLAEGAAYSVVSPVIDGYYASITTVAGTMGAADVAVEVVFNAIPANETYRLITDVNDLVAGGDYILVGIYNDAYYALSFQQSNNRRAIAVTVDEAGQITITPAYVAATQTEVYPLVLGIDADTGYYSFYDALTNGYLYAASSSSNYMRTQTENNANGLFTMVLDASTNLFTVTAQGTNTRSGMRFNPNNGTPLISCYASTSTLAGVYVYGNVNNDYPVAVETHTLTINYVYADGTVASDVYTASVEEGAAYSVTSPVIDGFTADVLTVEGAMGTADVTVTVTYTANAPVALLGDVNCDGIITFGDVTALYASLFGMGTLSAQGSINADYNGDGAVTFGDVTALYNALSGV